jgi:hypothetical protein
MSNTVHVRQQIMSELMRKILWSIKKVENNVSEILAAIYLLMVGYEDDGYKMNV